MGVQERKEQEKQLRRKDIVDAAETVFFSKGYEAATMDDVAKKAEFSKRTVYVYFRSKEQLYFEIMVRGYKILLKRIEVALGGTLVLNASAKIKLIGKTLYEFGVTYPDYFDAIMSYENGEKDFLDDIPDGPKNECYALGEELFGYLQTSLGDGVKEGEFRGDLDIVSTAIILWACTLGLFNTLWKKKVYVEHFHARNAEKLLTEGMDMLISTIVSPDWGQKNENQE